MLPRVPGCQGSIFGTYEQAWEAYLFDYFAKLGDCVRDRDIPKLLASLSPSHLITCQIRAVVQQGRQPILVGS